ncbi:hypothetical protein [Actinocrispum sp. NPDC049592]
MGQVILVLLLTLFVLPACAALAVAPFKVRPQPARVTPRRGMRPQ